MRMVRSASLPLVVVLLAFLPACRQTPAPDPVEGPWRAWLESPGGELPFGIEIGREGERLTAVIVNGDERIPVERVEKNVRILELGIDHYDAMIQAQINEGGRALDGLWSKTVAGGEQARLVFHARAGKQPRFETIPTASSVDDAGGFHGRWTVQFESEEQPAVGIFETREDGTAVGTFLTTTGDYRYLAGNHVGGVLRLSAFDGAHAFLFHAGLQPDGTLSGDFWSRDSWHETWTAVRDDGVELPDAFALTPAVEGVELDRLAFPDLDGRSRSLGEEEYAGRAMVLFLFGSWCPNCNDATAYMVELHRRFEDRGLSVIGLAFELTGEFERDAAQVARYAAYHGIDYPLLIAGRYGRDAESRSFPLIDRIRAYPTTIFLDGAGAVRAVHTGFSGPATGAAHQQLRAEFESRIDNLLAGSGE